MYLLIKIINLIFRIYSYMILARIILSWFSGSYYNPVAKFIYKITEPILAPFRIILPLGNVGLDLSPIIVFFLLNLLHRSIVNIIINVF